ncbi:UNVERIFIED_CONTAM: hypothetical protein FKN15_068934 [Acipenser sinensis]
MASKLGVTAVLLLILGLRECEGQMACGRRVLSSRIMGGADSKVGAWPWQVDLQDNGVHVCGGSLLNENWVLSAAHCFPTSSSVSNYQIYIGRYALNNFNQYEQSRRISQVFVHPSYQEPHKGFDIALVQLSSAVAFTDYIQPVCLPTSAVLFPEGMECWVTGWGNVGSSVSLPSPGNLQELQLPIISQSSCKQMYQVATNLHPTPSDILSDMICAGFQEGQKDACQGDSGGPLVCTMINGTWVQAGIVSWGDGCGDPNRPGVYVYLPAYSDWITQTVPTLELYGGAQNSLACSLSVCLNAVLSLLLVALLR